MGMEILIAVGLSVLVAILGYQWVRNRYLASHRQKGGTGLSLSESVSVEPRVLLAKSEAALFNVLRLAVQDSYLVLAKLPLRHIVKLDTQDQSAKRGLFKSIQRMTLDFVLVHPGTLTAAWVIVLVDEVESEENEEGSSVDLLDALCHESGIDVLRLDAQTTYTIPQLVQRLGLAEEE